MASAIEAVVEDHRTPVPDQVAFRCDFPSWLHSLPVRNRRIARALSVGHTTGEVAKRFNVSPGRISQLRQEFQRAWEEFTVTDSPRPHDPKIVQQPACSSLPTRAVVFPKGSRGPHIAPPASFLSLAAANKRPRMRRLPRVGHSFAFQSVSNLFANHEPTMAGMDNLH